MSADDDIDAVLKEIDRLAALPPQPISGPRIAVIENRQTGLATTVWKDSTSELLASSFTYLGPHHILSEKPSEVIQEQYLTPRLPSFEETANMCRVPPPKQTLSELYQIPTCPATTTISVVMDLRTGQPGGFEEIRLPRDASANASVSSSLSRLPGAYEDFHTGLAQNVPFRPGGMDDDEDAHRLKTILARDLDSRMLHTAPGMPQGLKFDPVTKKMSGYTDPSTQEVPDMAMFQPANLAPVEAVKPAPLSLGAIFGGLTETTTAAKTEAPAPPTVTTSTTTSEEAAKTLQEAEATLEAQLPATTNMNEPASAPEVYIAPAVGSQAKTEETRAWAVVDQTDTSDFEQCVPDMAFKYNFDLDPFQKRAVKHLERGECVFVAAHTSAGKTVVAEYAIALCFKHMTRAVYTSPIKALSNQKFRDFKDKFGEVGLLTGDVQIAPDSTCLVMTTEILRSMLYKGADVIRDIEWVIFDEVHYVNDLERGVVWEEVIIMLPAHVNLIMLSATVANTFEFADWIGRTKRKQVFVVSTPYRPVPLEHYLLANNEMYKLVDSKRNFLNLGYTNAASSFNKPEKGKPAGRGGGGGGGDIRGRNVEKNFWPGVVKTLEKKTLLPVVVFSFSKRKCEECGYNLSNVDLSTSREAAEIHIFIERSLSRLKGPDRELPQVQHMKEMLKRGIGVHHGGLLPIIKEIVEMLFSRGLCKVLFATETFAMGVNMPARTVVFNDIRKHDGANFRDLLPGEYTQMSGRAGRRGLDKVGTVLINCPFEVPEASVLHGMMLGQPSRLESKFRLTYNMILNLFRIEDMKVEDMIKRSFSEADAARDRPAHKLTRQEKEKALSDLEDLDCIFGEPDMENYYQIAAEAAELDVVLRQQMAMNRAAQQAMGPGRIIVLEGQAGIALAVVLRIAQSAAAAVNSRQYQVLVLPGTNVAPFDRATARPAFVFNKIYLSEAAARGDVVTIDAQQVVAITKTKIKVDVAAVMGDEGANAAITAQLLRLAQENPDGGPPAMHPVQDLGINDLDFAGAYARRTQLAGRLNQSKCHACPKRESQYTKVHVSQTIRTQLTMLDKALSTENMMLMPEFTKRTNVLKTMGYIDQDTTVQLKGRVACEVSSCDSLVVTEMIFSSKLIELEPEEVLALLSTMVFQEKAESECKLTERLQSAKEELVLLVRHLSTIMVDHDLHNVADDYTNLLKFGMMEVVYEWARGMPFSDITKLTDIQEGSIVRCITRLAEACRDVRNCARVIGDARLYQAMERAAALIKRDIVFAASLYVA